MYSPALCIGLVIVTRFNPITRSAPPLGCSVSHYKFIVASLIQLLVKPQHEQAKTVLQIYIWYVIGQYLFPMNASVIYSYRCNITIWASIRGFRIDFIVNHKILAVCIGSSLIGSLTHDHLFLSCQVSKAPFGEKTRDHRVPTRDISGNLTHCSFGAYRRHITTSSPNAESPILTVS
jgi:hypothetical protein